MIFEYDCLIAPVITEKTSNNKEGTYVFKVHQDATKYDISKSVEKIFNVTVANVNVLNRKGKTRIFRGKKGLTKSRRLAIVRLSKGTINYEGGV